MTLGAMGGSGVRLAAGVGVLAGVPVGVGPKTLQAREATTNMVSTSHGFDGDGRDMGRLLLPGQAAGGQRGIRVKVRHPRRQRGCKSDDDRWKKVPKKDYTTG